MSDVQILQIGTKQFDPMSDTTCLALGNFDGVHIGHQKLIEEAKTISEANGSVCSIMTFYPHPRAIITNKDDYHFLITPWQTKKAILRDLGVQLIFLVDFSHDFASISPEEFVTKYIKNANATNVIIGDDFRYGSLGQGTPASLESDGINNGFEVHTVPPVMYDKDKVSSSLIRKLLIHGDITEVRRLLNRPFRICGQVVDGEKRGRELGFPTANIKLTDNYLLPRHGVYLGEVHWRQERFLSVLNIGLKPTFNIESNQPTIEVHILNFNQNLYGEELAIDILNFIRSEIRFDNKEQLIEQINQDITTALELYQAQ